jgi:hypothetical protein
MFIIFGWIAIVLSFTSTALGAPSLGLFCSVFAIGCFVYDFIKR